MGVLRDTARKLCQVDAKDTDARIIAPLQEGYVIFIRVKQPRLIVRPYWLHPLCPTVDLMGVS